MKNKRNIIIGSIIAVILLMAVGYSAFATQLSLNGTAEIVGEWDVRITNIETKEVSDGCDAGEPQFTNTTATFNATLEKPGDTIIYVITIENQGAINATLGNVVFMSDDKNGSEAIIYSTTELDHELNVGEQTKLEVTVKYDPNATEIPNIKTKTLTGIIEYVQS